MAGLPTLDELRARNAVAEVVDVLVADGVNPYHIAQALGWARWRALDMVRDDNTPTPMPRFPLPLFRPGQRSFGWRFR